MPRFSETSRSRLATCHPDLQLVFERVIEHFDCTILCGHRGEEEQNRLHAAGKTQVLYPNSAHNSAPSMAVDVAPYPVEWGNRDRFHLFGGFVLGTAQLMYQNGDIGHLVRWGGDWDRDTQTTDNNFDDLPHFELVNP